MLQRSVALGIVAVGQTVVILLGSLDLSVAQLISLASLLTATTMDGKEANVVPAIALVLALGVGVGLVNGLIITKLRVNAFIATLGTALVISGFIQNRWDGPAAGRHELVLAGPRLHALRRDPDVVLPAGGRRDRGLLPAAQHALRLPHLRRRRLRGRVQALGPAHAPHDHRRARRVLADRGDHRHLPRRAPAGGHADGRHRRRLRPRVDRRGGPRRHRPDGRPRRRGRHDGRRRHPRRARQRLQPARVQRVPQGRRERLILIAAIAVYARRTEKKA